jgi:hypothetical protein
MEADMNRKRLEMAQETLRKVIAEGRLFSIGLWFDIDAGSVKQDASDEKRFPSACGMVACVGGYCAIDPWHRAEGLDRSLAGMPKLGLLLGRLALAEYWDIPPYQVSHIIYPESYVGDDGDADSVTPQMAIDHIQDVLDGKITEAYL